MSGVETLSLGALGGSYTGKRADPATMVRLITVSTSSTGFPNGQCRALQVGSSCTISFMDQTGSTIDGFPLKAFDNPIGARAIYSITGTTSIWALY